MLKPVKFINRLICFKYALSGIVVMLESQQNARLHAIATFLVVLTGLVLKITPADWCWITLAIVIVWTAEAFNTAIEFLCDIVSPQFNPLVKNAKDVAAGAVLIASIGAFAVGLLIFMPYMNFRY